MPDSARPKMRPVQGHRRIRRVVRFSVVIQGCIEHAPLLGDALLTFRVNTFIETSNPIDR